MAVFVGTVLVIVFMRYRVGTATTFRLCIFLFLNQSDGAKGEAVRMREAQECGPKDLVETDILSGPESD
jgi:hypothetical protein